MPKQSRTLSRRRFLKQLAATSAGAAGAVGFPTILRASALGKGGAVAPSNRIVMAGVFNARKIADRKIGELVNASTRSRSSAVVTWKPAR